MSKSQDPEKSKPSLNLDRPSQSVPSIDQAWDDPTEHEHRLRARRGDRSTHRAHHALYEDMLN